MWLIKTVNAPERQCFLVVMLMQLRLFTAPYLKYTLAGIAQFFREQLLLRLRDDWRLFKSHQGTVWSSSRSLHLLTL